MNKRSRGGASGGCLPVGCRRQSRASRTRSTTRVGLRLRRDDGLGSVRLEPDLDEHDLAVRLKPDTTEARARAVLSALFVQEACNNYIPIDVNKEYTAVAVCESMGRSTSDALAKVARRATESVNECRPTRLLLAPVRSKAAPSAKKLPPIEIGLDEKGSASILRTKLDAACAGTLPSFLADRSRIRLSHAASSAQQSSSRTMTYG